MIKWTAFNLKVLDLSKESQRRNYNFEFLPHNAKLFQKQEIKAIHLVIEMIQPCPVLKTQNQINIGMARSL